MYSKTVDLVISLVASNLCQIMIMAVAQPTWITYLTCVYLISILIDKGIDALTLQQPRMKPAIMRIVKEA